MKKKKNNIVILLLLVSILVIGCSNTKAIENKAEEENNQSITFDELEKIAVNNLGKDSDKDGKSKYVTYNEHRLTVNTNSQETAPDISEISQEDADNDMEKIKFLSKFYEFMKNEYDNFEKEILVNNVTIEDLNKMEMKYRDFIHGSYIEGLSKQALTTYFYTTLCLSKEYSELYDMIIVKNDDISEDEKVSRLDEINSIRLEVRETSDMNIRNVYKDLDLN